MNYRSLSAHRVFSRFSRIFLLFSVLTASVSKGADSSHVAAPAASPAAFPDRVRSEIYSEKAFIFYNKSNLDSSLYYAQKSIELAPQSAQGLYVLTLNYQRQRIWDKAIEYGEKCVRADTTYTQGYMALFYAYYGAGRWEEAIKAGEHVLRADPANAIQANMYQASLHLQDDVRSKVFVVILLLLLFAALLYLLNRARLRPNLLPDAADGPVPVVGSVLVAGSVSFILYKVFYLFSAWIWSFNPKISAAEFTASLAATIYEHDGIESYVLFALTNLNILITCLFYTWIFRNIKNLRTYRVVLSVLFVFTALYIAGTGFYPPVAESSADIRFSFVLIGIIIAVGSRWAFNMYIKYPRIVTFIILPLLFLMALLPIDRVSPADLSYIVAPGYKLLQGGNIRDIYFQYDLYLSFLAYLWLKLKLSLDIFPVIGSISFFALFAAMFLFARRFFLTNGLAVYMLIAVVILRFYAGFDFSFLLFQETPLRLDLWIIPLLFAYRKGYTHWTVGLSLGLLILLHRNLGIIYSISYILFIGGLLLFETADLYKSKTLDIKSFGSLLARYLKSSLINLIFIVMACIICIVYFGSLFSVAALNYRKYGFGMLQITENSFYWYMPVVFGVLITLLSFVKKKIPQTYFTISIFIVSLAVGNSMYFFGRSHENNILNISALLVLVIFIVFDLVAYIMSIQAGTADTKPEKIPKTTQQIKIPAAKDIAGYLPWFFVIVAGFVYANAISFKFKNQTHNLAKAKWYDSLNVPRLNTDEINRLTHGSRKLFFLDWDFDFYYYYQGRYNPPSNFNPMATWIFKRDLTAYLQKLLDAHYYLVYSTGYYAAYADMLNQLHFSRMVDLDSYTAVSEEPVKILLPDDPAFIHVGLQDSISKNGINFPAVRLSKKFTIEIILKPLAMQKASATILCNILKQDGYFKGIAIRQKGPDPRQFAFSAGTGTSVTPCPGFALEPDKWNYLVVCVDDHNQLVYNNGKLISTAYIKEQPMVNSAEPLTVGNLNQQKFNFSGCIKELKISRGTPDASQVENTWKKVNALNPDN